MDSRDTRLGMAVTFGRRHGAVAHGVVLKLGPAKAQVKLTEQFNSHPPGVVFRVPYSMMNEDGEGGGDFVWPRPAASKAPPKPKAVSDWALRENELGYRAVRMCGLMLEPEAATCDGERSASQVRAHCAEWQRKLEASYVLLGQRISLSEACKAVDRLDALAKARS
jgi:hypothetical protein